MALDMGHLLLFHKLACMREHKFENVFMRRHIASNAIEKFNWAETVEGETNVLDHLSVAHLDDDERTGARGQTPEVRFRKWIERDRAQETDLYAQGAGIGRHGFEDAANDAVTN